MKKNAFTLVELLVVVIIIGVLTTFAAPGFKKMQERTIDKDSKTMLLLMRDRVKMIKLTDGNYPACGSSGFLDCDEELDMDIADGDKWNYVVDTDGTDYTVSSTRTYTGGRTLWYSTKHTDDEIHCYGADCFFDGTPLPVL